MRCAEQQVTPLDTRGEDPIDGSSVVQQVPLLHYGEDSTSDASEMRSQTWHILPDAKTSALEETP